MSQYELDFVPPTGRVLLYVILTEIEGRTIAETLKLLEAMSYTPQLRYWQWSESSSNISLYALLKDEEIPQDAVGEYLLDEWQTLSKVIEPARAVKLAWGGVPEQSESN